MADKNEIEFKVRVTDDGLAPLASKLGTVEQKAEALGKTAATTGKQLDGMGGADGLAPLASTLDKVDQKTDELGQSAATTGKQLDGMGKVDGLATLPGQIDKVDQKTDELGKSAATTGKQFDGMGGQLTGIKNQVLALAGLDIGAGMIKDLAETADEFKNLESKIRLVVGANGDVAGTMARVKDVAQQTFTSLDGTTQLFTRLAATAKELGISQTDALDITRTINQAIQVSGASAQASEAAVQQLVQGLQSGTLRGDEFNSVMEQAPRLAKALADGLGLPVGALRGLAEEGKLTSAVVVKALQGQREAIEGEFTQLPLTVGRAVQNLQTEFTAFVGLLDGTTGASSLVAQGIQALADHMDTLARVAGAAGAAMTAALAVQGVAALRAMSGSASVLTANLAKIPRIISITVAAVGFEIGFRIGTWLYENSELARKLGVGVTEFITGLVSDLQFVAEAAAAIFTDDTVGAAFDRYRDRAKEMEANFKGLYEDAKNAPVPIAAAATQAADSTTAMGNAAQGAGTKVADAGAAGAKGIGGIKTEADKAKDALQLLEKSINLSDSLGIAKAGAGLRELLNTGKITAEQFSEAWSKALAKNPDLVKFEQDAKLAFTGVEGGARLLSDAMNAGLREAIRRSGADFELLSGGMGKAAQSALNDTDLIIGNLAALKAQGVDAGRALQASLSKAINTADGQKSVDELRGRIELMRTKLGEKVTDGLLSDLQKQAEKLGATFEKLPEKAKTQAERVAEAFKDAGIKTQAELDKLAVDAEKRFFLISTSGKASADGVKRAWQQMAEASIAANGGVASETLQAEAATYGLEIQVDKTGKAIVRAMGEGRDRMRDFTAETDRATTALERQRQQLQELQRLAGAGGDLSGVSTDDLKKAQADLLKNGGALSNPEYIKLRNELMGRGASKTDKDGFTLDKSGNRLAMGGELTTLTGIKNFLEQAGLDEEQAKRVALEFSDGKGNIPYFSNAGQIKYGGRSSTMSEALLKAAERTTFGGASVGGSGSKVGGAGGTTGGSTNHTVVVQLGGRRTTVNTASAADSQALTNVIKELEAAALRAS